MSALPTQIPAAQYLRKSTEHQRYSIDAQRALIEAYASERGFYIVKSYVDDGRSGVTINRRTALQQLLSEVQSGRTLYRAILVSDVSRWGRFQDVDESAYYEYACKRCGISVHYCSEQFDNDGTPLSILIKGMKRVMAAEFSRELGAKVFAGQKRVVEKGFRLGSRAGYGLRRMLVDPDRNPKQLLNIHDRKNVATDRIILVPGPEEEIKVVRWIYNAYLHRGMNQSAIARSLNRRRIPNGLGTHWDVHLVSEILTNPKYVGGNVWNRSTERLGSKKRPNPSSAWIWSSIGYQAIVSKETFGRAQRLRASRKPSSKEEILERLRAIFVKHGKVTKSLIDRDKPSMRASSVGGRFGTLGAAYKLIGFSPDFDTTYIDVNRDLRAMRDKLVEQVRLRLEALGRRAETRRAGRNTALHVNGTQTVYFVLARCRTAPGRLPRWRIQVDKRTARRGSAVVLRTDQENKAIVAYYFVPFARRIWDYPALRKCDWPALDFCRIASLAQLCERIELHA